MNSIGIESSYDAIGNIMIEFIKHNQNITLSDFAIEMRERNIPIEPTLIHMLASNQIELTLDRRLRVEP
jgi:hypothetical protein